jgi:hypothetical protein
MTVVVAGTGSDLTASVTSIIRDLLANNWPGSAYDPVASDVGFGLTTWDNYGDIDIHITTDTTSNMPDAIGSTIYRVRDRVIITLFVRKNADTIPDSMGNAQRMVNKIITENALTLGQGINSVTFDGWDRIIIRDNLQDVWQVAGHATAIYWLVKV